MIKKSIFIVLFIIIVLISLFFYLNSNYHITTGGSYKLSGNYKCITINTKDMVDLKLENVNIKCNNGSGINITSNNDVNITITGMNSISAGDMAIYSKGNIELSGDGTLNIKVNDDGVHANGDMKIISGNYIVSSSDDAIHADGMVNIIDGTFKIKAHEGIEATYVKIDGGTIDINASDDGINAGHKSKKYPVMVEVNNGKITINMDPMDADGIDSNGNLYINGGEINITSNSSLDYDGEFKYTGGTIIVNGKEVKTIVNQSS